MFLAGQGILGKIRFVDGKYPAYNRTYLVIKAEAAYIEVLNVSSTFGKEHKLLFPANKEIKSYRPPFLKPSFVKLDSAVKVFKQEWPYLSVLYHGEPMDKTELLEIIASARKIAAQKNIDGYC